jgi:hypothetical protein
MRSPIKSSTALGLVFALLATTSTYSVSPPAIIVPGPTPPSRWAISAGIAFRQMGADFDLRNPGRLPTGGLFTTVPDSSSGAAGVFTGGPNIPSRGTPGGAGTVVYQDGFVGGQWYSSNGNPDGTAYGQINSASQVAGNGRAAGGLAP